MTNPIPPRWAFAIVEREYSKYRNVEPNSLNIDVVMDNPTGWPMHHAWAAFLARTVDEYRWQHVNDPSVRDSHQ